MKRFTRYWQAPDFRAAVDRELARAKVEGEQPGWITYAIHDPTTPDQFGEFNTLIVYVGQSKDFASRVKRRLREAGTATRRPTSYVQGLMYDIMRRGDVPRFRVIERANDAIESFVSETNWAQQYVAQGYPLRNKWKEQRLPAELMTRDTVPQKWLWRLAVEDAIEARFTIVAIDKASGTSIEIDLSAERPKELLRNCSIQFGNADARAWCKAATAPTYPKIGSPALLLRREPSGHSATGPGSADKFANIPLLFTLHPAIAFIRLAFRDEPSKLSVLPVKAGKRGVETSHTVARSRSSAGWHARMSSRQR